MYSCVDGLPIQILEMNSYIGSAMIISLPTILAFFFSGVNLVVAGEYVDTRNDEEDILFGGTIYCAFSIHDGS